MPSTSTSSPAACSSSARPQRGEKLVTLDGVERVLETSDVVVADAERAVSLAGIMGGLDTAVTAGTKNVLLEAAWWDPVTVRPHRAPPRHAHGRLAPLRARRRPRRHSRSPRLRGAADRRGRRRNDGARDSSTRSGPCCGSGKPRCACRGSACSPATAALNLDFAEEALQRLGFSTERQGQAPRRLDPALPRRRAARRRPRRGGPAGLRLRPAALASPAGGLARRTQGAAPARSRSGWPTRPRPPASSRRSTTPSSTATPTSRHWETGCG